MTRRALLEFIMRNDCPGYSFCRGSRYRHSPSRTFVLHSFPTGNDSFYGDTVDSKP